MEIFEEIYSDVIRLRKRNGTTYEDIRASVQTKIIFIPDSSIPVIA